MTLIPAAPQWQGYRATADPKLLAALTPFRGHTPLWVVTSGEAGMRAQALGLAEALDTPYTEWVWPLAPPWRRWPACALLLTWLLRHALPRRRDTTPFATAWQTLCRYLEGPPQQAKCAPPHALDLPALHAWPQTDTPAPPRLIVACGRRVIAPVLWLKRAAPTRPKVLYVQDPRTLSAHFDLIVAPAHDPIRGANVVPTPFALHRITPERLAHAAAIWQPKWAPYPKPWWGLVVGGPSRSVQWDEALARTAIRAWLEQARAAGATLFATTARRTPAATRAWLAQSLAAICPGSPPPFTGEGENPYLAILALTAQRAITSDSVSMLSETLAAPGTSVRLEVGTYRPRLQRFHRVWDQGATPSADS
ncbi:mitochondrial fission ELM1 family protein [Hydrogenophilus thermoluteolus]|uniref:Nucleoside-diphosphate sugar epimerase n=1 Tax=Hydrogenophilus thermoluteolus TaxID=297 RepID=A0A2Z6E108_HYDTE|nr:ELM1/GtrOC1 family putative glycosyltransferase [Hydrogenophilus thermoluteolus]BBD78225.1 hypothetical protein HPTL_1971 [Hydrogenophilus thermoluteolus]